MGTEYKHSIINDFCKNFKIKNLTFTAHHHLKTYQLNTYQLIKLIGTCGFRISYIVLYNPFYSFHIVFGRAADLSYRKEGK